MKKLVLYGGAFNPIHNGHIKIALEASAILDADVVFIPTAKPRWKEVNTSDKDRLEMLRIALDEVNNPRFSISTIEMERKEDTVTYTCDTIKAFKDMYPDTELILLIGGDQVSVFHKWHEPDYISENASIYFVGREGYNDVNNNKERYKMTKLSDLDAGEVSSSAIGELNFIDTSLGVLNYIEEHSLYYVDKLKRFLKEKRLKHSLSVAKLSYEIALRNNLDNPGKAYIAGALHDIGKELIDEEAKKLVTLPEGYPSWAYHQWTGAYLAEHEFGILDKEILDAIACHCTGKADMSPLAMIIYAADKIDPLRGWNSKEYIDECLKDYKKGFIKVLAANKEFLKAKNIHNNPSLSSDCYKYYLGE